MFYLMNISQLVKAENWNTFLNSYNYQVLNKYGLVRGKEWE
jgi:hypothetical protein